MWEVGEVVMMSKNFHNRLGLVSEGQGFND